MATEPVNALTAACPECGDRLDMHTVDAGCEDGGMCTCPLSWLDVLRRLADPTWPDRDGRAPVVWISPTGNVWRGVRLPDGSWAAWPPDLPEPMPVVASDEEDRRG